MVIRQVGPTPEVTEGNAGRARLLSDAVFLTLAQYIAVAIGLATTIYAARLLGPTGFGLATLAVTVPNLIWQFLATKSSTVTAAFLARAIRARQYDAFRNLFHFGLRVDVAAAALTFFASLAAVPLLHRANGQPSALLIIILVYAASFAAVAVAANVQALLLAAERKKTLAGLQIVESVLTIVAVVLLVPSGGANQVTLYVASLALAQFAAAIFNSVTGLILMRRIGWTSGQRQALAEDIPRRSLGSLFGWNYLLVSVVGAAVQLPLLGLGWFGTPSDVAAFRIALTIGIGASYIESALAKTVYPILSTMPTSHYARQMRAWTRSIGLGSAVALAASAFLTPLAVPLAFGAEYQDASLASALLVVSAAVAASVFWAPPYFYARSQLRPLTLLRLSIDGTAILVATLVGAQLGVTTSAAILSVGRGMSALVVARRALVHADGS